MAMMVKCGDDGVVAVESFIVIVALGPSILPVNRFNSAKRASKCFTPRAKESEHVISKNMQD